ncbi:MAG TPA: VWA domain-containing protein, partial [bacterium]|nr:VWA domain-containing protein [bacterium]
MARPTLTGVTAGDARGATSAVIVLDGSYSMSAGRDGVTMFEKAQDRAREILDTFAAGDEVHLFVPGGAGPTRTEGVRDPGLIREAVDGARAGQGAADLAAAVREAAGVLADARHFNREIHVVSDFQRGSWNAVEGDAGLPESISLFLFPVERGVVPENAWVEAVDYSGQILE